ncbi:MAG: DUF3568 family protein [Verrucomicrobia bacterium]|nr:DUF3568 family protein [Verrucomicrobiota bacterium]
MKLRHSLPPAALVAVLAAVLLHTGCIATVDGHTKAAVPFRKDKLVSLYEFPLQRVLDAARQALKDNGVIHSENVVNHSFFAKCNERAVWVSVTDVKPTQVQVITQVRTRWGGTDIDLAAEIDKQIALNLQTGLIPKPSSVPNP